MVPIAIFIVSLCLFTVGLCHQEIIGFESRFYLFALEMWRHGPSWFPTTYQHPYADYPALGTFLIYVFAKMMGGVSKFVAVLPSAIAAAITVTMTYLIGALHNKRWGMASALFLLFTVTFLMEARTISLDMFIAAITTTCFYLVYSSQSRDLCHFRDLCHSRESGNPLRTEASTKMDSRFRGNDKSWWIFLLFILGFAFRGPLGLVIPAGVVCSYYLVQKQFKRFFVIGIISAFILILCCLILLGLAYHVGGMDFMQHVVKMELMGRMQQGAQNPPIYYYFVEALGAYAITFPLAILVFIGTLFKRNITPEKKLVWLCIAWTLIILIGLSIPGDKKVRYILSISPALALICGYLFVANRDQFYLSILSRLFYGFCFIFPIFAILISCALHIWQPQFVFHFKSLLIVLSVIQLLIILLRKNELRVFALTTFAFVSIYILAAEPINLYLNETKKFVHNIEKIRHQQDAVLVFYREGMDGFVIKYLINMKQEEKPLFIQNLQELNQPAVIISREKYQSDLKSLQQVGQGKIGRSGVVVYLSSRP